MLMTIVAIYSIYVMVSIYVSVMQIGFVNKAKRKSAVLMSQRDFLDAGNYAVKKEKLSIVEAFINYLVFILWLGFGIDFLESLFITQDEIGKNIAIVMGLLL